MPKLLATLLLFFSLLASTYGQQPLAAIAGEVQAAFDQLAKAQTDAERGAPADSLLTAMGKLVKHPDALAGALPAIPISTVSSADGKVRIFTWNIPADNGSYRYHGFIISKGRKENDVISLRDSTRTLNDVESRELYPGKWYGAIYYGIQQVKRGGKVYYTLLGWKGYDRTETQKVIEVLHFSGRRPRLGAALFEHTGEKQAMFRRVFKYAVDTRMSLDLIPNKDEIIFDHLSPIRGDLKGQYAFYGPDMSYDRYSWNGRTWGYERDIDVKGNIQEQRIWNKPLPPKIR